MMLRLPLLAASLTLLGIAPAQPPMTPEEASVAGAVRAHVEFLADDRLEGRDTGSRGHEIAAAYVASRFREIGLQPAGPGGSWFLPVPLRRATTGQPAPTVTLISGGRSHRLRFGVEAAVAPSVRERHRTLDAPLLFVGYGFDEPLLGFDDYRGLDARGRIVVALGEMPDGVPPDIAAHLRVAKQDTAARHGAVGFIELPRDPRVPGRVPDVGGLAGRAVLDWVGHGEGDGPASFAEIALSPDWQEHLFDGAPQTLAAIRAAATGKARPRGFPLPARLALTADSVWRDFTSPEVVGRLPGADPRLAAEHVMLMAHLDHLGIRADARPGEDAIYNGALDNAAGVATLIAVARDLAAGAPRPARSLLFVANTGEERGLLGAGYFAAHPPVPIASLASVVDLDMPLALYDFTDVTVYGGDYSTLGSLVRAAARPMGIAVSADPIPQEAIFTRSDHYRFVQQGIPSILLMTGFANGGKLAWRRFLAGVYHSPADDLSQPIEWRSLARYALLNARIARALADAPQRPQWYAGDYFGDRYAPAAPRTAPGSP